MKPLMLLLAAGLFALPFSASAKIERVIEKSFTVTPGGLLKVETQGGDIRVTSGPGDEVKVVAKQHFRADTEGEADEVAKELSIQIEQTGSDVSAVAKYEGKRVDKLWRAPWPPVQVEFVVTVPSNYRANLRTSGGDIRVGDLKGDVDLRTSGGDIVLTKIDGNVEARTSGGDITIEEALRSATANTSGGDIRVRRVVGPATLSTSGGDIRVDGASDVVHAKTSGGDVSAHFMDTISADCTLRTSGGDVTVSINPSAAFRLDASTSGGNVRVKGLALEIQKGGNGKSSLVGVSHGGGHELKLRTSGGNVRVATQ